MTGQSRQQREGKIHQQRVRPHLLDAPGRNPWYLLTLVASSAQASGSSSFTSPSGDLIYPLFTLLLHLFHLADTLVPLGGKKAKEQTNTDRRDYVPWCSHLRL